MRNVTAVSINPPRPPPPPLRLFCAGVSWGRVWGQGGNNKRLAVSGAELHSAGWV